MSIMIEITQKIPLHSIMKTPSGKAQFEFHHRDSEKVVIKTEGGSQIKIPGTCFENAPNFLREKGWTRIGALHDTSYGETFDGFLKRFTSGTSVASYVAPILEKAEIVEIDRSRPAKLRLKTPKSSPRIK